MSVYVDSLKTCIKNRNWKYRQACHLIADTLKELHDFARKIKMPILWFRNRQDMPHYDLTAGKRTKAIRAGAIEISSKELVNRLSKNRKARLEKKMPVYVTPLKSIAQKDDWQEGKHCMLLADNAGDLRAFAKDAGFDPLWFQKRIGIPTHYDLTESMRGIAITMGAVEITDEEVVERMKQHISQESRKEKDGPMRTIIAGSRNIEDYEILKSVMSKIEWVPSAILSGGAKGVDRLGESWAHQNCIDLTIYEAEWDKFGNSAGYKRNELMANNAEALVAIWDGSSKGTKHMIDLATAHGLKIYVHNIGKENKMPEPTNQIHICNLNTEKPQYPYDVKVCRGVSPLGNPEYMADESQRDTVCDSYPEWLQDQLNITCNQAVINELLRLIKIYEDYGVLRLFCFCAPKRCHSETIKTYILEAIKSRKENKMVDLPKIQDTSEFKGTDNNIDGYPVTAFDTETKLIDYFNPIPPMMCMTHADAGAMQGSLMTPWEQDIDKFFRHLFVGGMHSVGHNTSFDLSILAFQYPDLLPYIFDALDRGLIHDTLLREKLLNLTLHGNFEMIERNGSMYRPGYKLTDLENKYLNIVDRSHLKDDADAPRMNYAMWENIPSAKWDEESISYAIDDAVNTGLIYVEQENARRMCIETTGYDPFAVETFRVKISFALRLLECVGERMDPEKVLEVTERFEAEYAQPRLREPLLAAGLLTDVIPPQPYAKGTLAHTETCDAMKDVDDMKKRRKDKSCGCPVKMKKAEPEHNPKRPLHQHIWNLAYKNPHIEAWPAEACEAALRKAGVFNQVIVDKAFSPQVVASTSNLVEQSQKLVAAIAVAAADGEKALSTIT